MLNDKRESIDSLVNNILRLEVIDSKDLMAAKSLASDMFNDVEEEFSTLEFLFDSLSKVSDVSWIDFDSIDSVIVPFLQIELVNFGQEI